MICWTDLCKWEGRGCGCSERKNLQAQADRFMALVAASAGGLMAADEFAVATDESQAAFDAAPVRHAMAVMSEIERRVKAGELFVEVKP